MSAVGVSVKPEVDSRVIANRIPGFARRPWAASLLLVVATIALYYPVHTHPFTNYDDRGYVYENPRVQAGVRPSTVTWAFTTFREGNWHPLTWLSHALDWQLFGKDASGHHDVNVLFHALDAVLLFWVLWQATGFMGRSFVVAALFALHPLNVESVAWVAERKNVLSMMFFLLALIAYRWYAVHPRVGRYGVVAALFALGLMAKPQIITLPLVLLLWDYWPLRRMFPNVRTSSASLNPAIASPPRKSLIWLLLEKAPLLAIAGASAVITLKAQQQARNWVPRIDRVGNAVLSYGLYVKRAIWPARLALLYPHPGDSLNWSAVVLAGVMLLAVTVVVIAGWRHRYLPVGWLWFLGTLVPMLGIVQVGVQAMADRYAYISLIGLFIMVCWGAAELGQRLSVPAFLLPGVSVVCLLLLALVARHQVGYWQNDETLWAHTLQVTTRNWVAEGQYGTALAIDGKVAQAMPHFYNAVAIKPDDSNSNMGIAIYDMQQKNYRDALQHFDIVVRDKQLRPSFQLAVHKDMAKCYQALGETAKAQESLEKASEISDH